MCTKEDQQRESKGRGKTDAIEKSHLQGEYTQTRGDGWVRTQERLEELLALPVLHKPFRATVSLHVEIEVDEVEGVEDGTQQQRALPLPIAFARLCAVGGGDQFRQEGIGKDESLLGLGGDLLPEHTVLAPLEGAVGFEGGFGQILYGARPRKELGVSHRSNFFVMYSSPHN